MDTKEKEKEINAPTITVSYFENGRYKYRRITEKEINPERIRKAGLDFSCATTEDWLNMSSILLKEYIRRKYRESN